MSSTAQFGSMKDLLASVTASKTANSKQASDAVNPPTDGPGSGKPENESGVTEGERSAENDAFIRDHLGGLGAEGAPGPDAHTGDYHQELRATPLKPTGEDPESESNSQAPPTMAEPGTSAPGLELTKAAAAWVEDATNLMVDLAVEGKLASSAHLTAAAKSKLSAATAPAKTATTDAAKTAETSTESEEFSDPCLALAAGDHKRANEFRSIVQNQAIEAALRGHKLAEATIEFLNSTKKSAAKAPALRPAQPRVAAFTPARKVAMDPSMMAAGGGEEMPPEMAGGGMPPEMAGGGMPPEMAGGGMPPEMGGGGMEGADPAAIEEAINELAAKLGLPPEQLIEQLIAEAEMSGGGGGGDMGGEMGGMPPAEESAPPAEESAPPAEESAPADDAETKEAIAAIKLAMADNNREAKHAAVKNAVKNNALNLLMESLQRGRR